MGIMLQDYRVLISMIMPRTFGITPASVHTRKFGAEGIETQHRCGQILRVAKSPRLWCAGAGGSVFFGLMLKNTDVAIKVVDSPTPKQQRSFVKEILMLKACHHPNIIQ
jgi:hypothetical protein